jgi:hypothetical protein
MEYFENWQRCGYSGYIPLTSVMATTVTTDQDAQSVKRTLLLASKDLCGIVCTEGNLK